VAWSTLPVEIAYRITERVKAGAGVLLVNAEISKYPSDPMLNRLLTREPGPKGCDAFGPIPYGGLVDATPADAFAGYKRFEGCRGAIWQATPRPDLSAVEALDRVEPYALTRNAMRTYRIGRGRFVHLRFPSSECNWYGYRSRPVLVPGLRLGMRNLWLDDYTYALTAKACLYAAGRSSSVRIKSIDLPAEVLAMGAEVQAGVSLQGDGQPFRGVLEVVTRDAITGWMLGRAETEVTLSGGKAQKYNVVVPGRLEGDAFVNVRLLRNGKGVDFGAAYVRAKTEVNLQLELAKETVAWAEPVRGSVVWPDGEAPAGVRLELYDAKGRLWERRQMRVRSGRNAFALPTGRTRMLVYSVRAVASRNGRPVGAATRSFTTRRPRPGFYVTASGSHWATHHMLRRYQRVYEWGVDGWRSRKTTGNRAAVAAMAGFDVNPDMPPIKGWQALNPIYVKHAIETGAVNSRRYRQFNQAIYNSTDDSGPWGRFHAQSFSQFPGFLRRTYGDIGRLNTEWGTTFDRFDAIGAPFVKESQKVGRVAVWSDYLEFLARTYLDVQARYAKAIRDQDPNVAVGCDALHYEQCLTRLYRQLGYIMPYYTNLTVELGRSLAKGPKPVYTGVCMGSYGYFKPTQRAREFFPWHVLTSGNRGVLFWSFGSLWGDLVMGDPRLAGWTASEIGRIKRSGAGEFLTRATRLGDGVAILYSDASRRAETCGTRFAKLEDAAVCFQEMIEDQGLQFDYISSECITQDNVLARGRYRLLILPHVQAMSEVEARAVQAFVKAGGHVWADVEPAMRNAHGRYLAEQGLLDDVFGIRRTRPPGEARYGRKVRPPHCSAPFYVKTDPSIAVTSGQALASLEGVPLMVRNRCGRGEAMLLNFSAGFYQAKLLRPEKGDAWRPAAPARAVRPMTAELLGRAGIQPAHALTLDGALAVGVELVWYRAGDARLLAVLVKPLDGVTWPARLTVPLGKACYPVDIRSGRAWPKTDTIDLSVSAYDAFVFALCDEKPGPFSVEANRAVTAGQDVTAAAVDKARTTLFSFVLETPSGVVLRDYTRQMYTDTGRASCRIAVPWNTTPGVWRLHVRNLLTGQTVTRPVTVRRAD
jgi:glycosyl hydrolase family 42 (putative beta-galactosidase)